MTYYIQALLLTLFESICCKIFLESFLTHKVKKIWFNMLFFLLMTLSFFGISLIPTNHYWLKAVLCISVIIIISVIQYKGKLITILFMAAGYYGLLICIDNVMITLIQIIKKDLAEQLWDDPVKGTILALLCKIVLFVVVICINRKFGLYGNINLIMNKEWFLFLLFPITTIVLILSMSISNYEGSSELLLTAFVLVFSNILIFYIINGMIKREKKIQEMSVLQELTKNQFSMYQYMEEVYDQQKKKTHDYKNNISCLNGLLSANKFDEAKAFIKKIDENWINELDYINTNNSIVNSILNQKYKQAKRNGIQIAMTVNDLSKLAVEDEDIVIILANLLDNAIEACENVQPDNREIKLRLLLEENELAITVRNPVKTTITNAKGELVTTKRNKSEHGIGMKNIQKVVNKYRGENIWSCKQGYFTHNIIIQLQK